MRSTARLARTAPIVALALLVGTCAACGAAPPTLQATAPSPSRRAEELAQRTVALIATDTDPDVDPASRLRTYCSGVWVSSDSFLTASHCTRAQTLGDTIKYAVPQDVADNGVTGVRVGVLVARDDTHDLALVRDRGAPAHSEAKIATVTVGQNVHSMGHPLGLWWSYSRGEVAAIRLRALGEHKAMWWVQATAPISPGNSGGGLFDDNGDLVGIATGQMNGGQNLNLFSDPRYAKAFLAASTATRGGAK